MGAGVSHDARWRLLRYDIPLHRPLTTGGGRTRSGLILERRQGQAVGHGEAAPIPGFHSTDLDAVQRQVIEAMAHGTPPDAAVARFCVESAEVSLAAALAQTRPAALLASHPAATTPLNALIDHTAPAGQARALATAGCTAAKIKVGRRGLEHEIAAIRAVAQAAPGMRIRLDANRAWTLEDACRFADALQGIAIDYLEEPLRDPAQLAAFHERTGVRIGLDESLAEGVDTVPAGTAALVIKPTVVGGLHAATGLIRRAGALGLQAVISATFETSVGLGMLTELACATGPEPVPQGLGTWRWLAEDVVTAPLRPQGFRLRWAVPRLNNTPRCVASG